MSMPFYVSPEQLVADKTNFVRKNIAKGRPLVALVFEGGILIAAETTSRLLHKISEVYDRIAFAGVGLYTEYDQLRQGGVRYADVAGYRYSREDVHARALAMLYGQTLGQSFTHELKPMEVEILVAEVGLDREGDELYHVMFNGIVIDEDNFLALGSEAEAINQRIKEGWSEAMALGDALKLAVKALAGPDRAAPYETTELEVAVLDRGQRRRAFRRIEGGDLKALLA